MISNDAADIIMTNSKWSVWQHSLWTVTDHNHWSVIST